MTDKGYQTDVEYFRELVRPLAEHPEWTLTGNDDAVDTAVERAAASTLGELFYRHQPTTARLHVRMPDQGTPRGVLDAILDQPLDPQLPQTGEPDTFTAALSDAHRIIAEKHATAYIVPKSDPHMVLNVAVPVDYEPPVFEATVEAVGKTAKVVERLHCDIKRPLEAHLE